MVATSELFYTHGLFAILTIGIVFTLIGTVVGWLVWRGSRLDAERLASANSRLRAERDRMKIEVASLESRLNELNLTQD